MKNFVSFLIFLLIFMFSQGIINAQTQILVEHFNYVGLNDTSALIYASTNWNTHSGIAGQVNLLNSPSDTAGSLKYSNNYNWYFNASEGNRIELTQNETEDVGRDFDMIYNSDTVYTSFLLKVISVPGTSVNYFLHFFSGTGGTTFGGCVWITQGSDNSHFRLGVSKRSTGTASIYGTDLNLNQTYLVIVAYIFVNGSNNDISALWINPVLNSLPAPTITESGTETDLNNVGRLGLRQSSGIGTLEIDEIRIATSWNLAPLPVELSSFSVVVLDNGVKLNWRTETEVNNYGFEILRQAQDDTWQVLGFVEGYGNSNSPKNYSFIDKNVSSGKISYRLKQIDTDGQFEYSKIIEVDFGSPIKFELSQNYPNPFNPSTTIRFTLPQAGNVKLTVYNLLGEEVAQLVNEFKEAGVHTINFNASGLNSGVYIYKLEANGLVQTRKMTLLK